MIKQNPISRMVAPVSITVLCLIVALAGMGLHAAYEKLQKTSSAIPPQTSTEEQKYLVALGRPLPEPDTSEKPDLVDLHGREDLLLNNYTWADAAHTKVRIPIERAMELTVERGLPVEDAKQKHALLKGEKPLQTSAPLTDGYAPTALDAQR
ncbi:hypothetical protein ACOBR2_17590 [Telmatobacter bradus]|uniref:hypothetical protein n=1 Tax=Telmatobacter bradus TaxID=474953 RepID=UPI003B428E27